jgi:hypothetical protein
MGQVTLLSVITSGEVVEAYDIEQLVELLGSRCRRATKDKLYRRLRLPSLLPTAGIFGRVHLDEYEGQKVWSYCAGQSYADEIRLVRQTILEG